MPTDFSQYLYEAYLSPLPKKMLVIILTILFIFIVNHFLHLDQIILKWAQKKSRKPLFFIFVAALVIRITWCLVSPTAFPRNYDTNLSRTESSLISVYAVQISHEGIPLRPDGSLSTRRPVGYPYLLGLLYRVFGYHDQFFKFLQVIMDSVLIFIFFLLGKSFFGSAPVGILCALLVAVYPTNWSSVNIVLDEFPFFICWFFSIYLVSENIRKRKFRSTIWIGVLLGLASAFRTPALYSPFIFLIAYWVAKMSFWKSLKQMVLVFILIYVVNIPWALITYKHFGLPCFFTTGRANYYGTLNDLATWHNGYLPTISEGGHPEFLNETNPVKRSQIGVRLAAQWVAKNPGKTLRLIVMRNLAMYGFDLRDQLLDLNVLYATGTHSAAVILSHPLRKLKGWSYAYIVVFGVLGFLIMLFRKNHFFWKHYPSISVLVFIFLYWTAVHGFFFGYRKYRWTMELIFLFPSAFFLWKLLSARYFSRKALTK